MIYHQGLAEALNVTEAQLEDMTMREMVERAHALGGTLTVGTDEGVGPGLTLRAKPEQQSAQHKEG